MDTKIVLISHRVGTTAKKIINLKKQVFKSAKQYLCAAKFINCLAKAPYGITVKLICMPPEFKCDLCPKTFHYKCSRNRHMTTHMGTKPYECKDCKKRFERLTNLRHHQERYHSTEWKYKCQICEKLFKTRPNLWSHKKVHSKPEFECPFCKKKFTRSEVCWEHWNGNSKGQIARKLI